MATSAKIKGALSVLEPDGSAPDYNAQMDELKGMLVNPEQDKKDEMLAWAGGLGSKADGSGLAGALGRATAAESDQRLKDKELKARYVPLVMNALAAQQQAQQLARLQGIGPGGLDGGTPIKDMTLEQVQAAENAGNKGLFEKWKATQSGLEIKQGWNVLDGKRVFVSDPTKFIGVDEQGNVVPLKGGLTTNSAITRSTEGTKASVGAQYGVTPTMQNGVPGIVNTGQLLNSMGAGDAANSGVSATPGAAPALPNGPRPTAPSAQQPSGQPAPLRTVGGLGGVGTSINLPNAQATSPGSFAGTDDQILAAINGIPDPQERANALQSYAQQQQNGKVPPWDPGMVGPGAAAAPSTRPATSATPGALPFAPTGQSPTDKLAQESASEMNKSWQKHYDLIQERAGQAQSIKDGMNTARVAMRQLGDDSTGWGTDKAQKAAEILGAFGVKNAQDKAASYQMFQQTALSAVNEKLNLAKGTQTEGDAQRAGKTVVSLGNTPKANEFMLDYAQAVAERDQRRGDFYLQGAPLARAGGDMTKVDASWRKVDKSIWESPIMRRWNTPTKKGE